MESLKEQVQGKQTPSCSSFEMVHLRILLCLDKFAHRRPRKLQFPCNRSLRELLFKKRAHVCIASSTLVPSYLLLELIVVHAWWPLIGRRGNGPVMFMYRWESSRKLNSCPSKQAHLN